MDPAVMLCSHHRPGCTEDAIVGVRTTAPPGQGGKGALRTQIFWNIADAPKTAELLCEKHSTELLVGMVKRIGTQP